MHKFLTWCSCSWLQSVCDLSVHSSSYNDIFVTSLNWQNYLFELCSPVHFKNLSVESVGFFCFTTEKYFYIKSINGILIVHNLNTNHYNRQSLPSTLDTNLAVKHDHTSISVCLIVLVHRHTCWICVQWTYTSYVVRELNIKTSKEFWPDVI